MSKKDLRALAFGYVFGLVLFVVTRPLIVEWSTPDLSLSSFVPYVHAQESYAVPANATQVTQLDVMRNAVNRDNCARYAQVAACTQAQVCTAANVAGGASCTAAAARAAGVRIYPATQAGREEFFTFEMAKVKFDEMLERSKAENHRDTCTAWLAANTTQRNSACTAIGRPTGCDFGC